MTEEPDDVSRKHQELMLRIARRPGFCCCCICIPRQDRRRARRIFRLTRGVTRAWEKEREEARKIEAGNLTQNRS
jgi:hypothetical protein